MTLRVTVLLYLRMPPGAVAATALGTWYADILTAMIGTTTFTHGGTCHFTHYKGLEVVDVEGQQLAGYAFDFELLYTRRVTAL